MRLREIWYSGWSLTGPAAVLAVGLLLTGCGGSTNVKLAGTAPPPQRAKSVVAYSYSGIDKLIEDSAAPIDPHRPVLVTTVADDSDLAISSPFGRLVSEQMTSRLADAGYLVYEIRMGHVLKVKPGTGQLILTDSARKITTHTGAQAVVVGTYTIAHNKVFVTLRLVRTVDNRILSADDYSVPLTPNVAHLLGGAGTIPSYHPG